MKNYRHGSSMIEVIIVFSIIFFAGWAFARGSSEREDARQQTSRDEQGPANFISFTTLCVSQ